ncbi:hypothetical protein Tco_1562295 [Tanacetum coccineum]
MVVFVVVVLVVVVIAIVGVVIVVVFGIVAVVGVSSIFKLSFVIVDSFSCYWSSACPGVLVTIVIEEEDREQIRFLGDNSSSRTKKYQGSNSSDGGNIGDGVKIAGGVIGSGGEKDENTGGIILEFSEELKELLPAEAGK